MTENHGYSRDDMMEQHQQRQQQLQTIKPSRRDRTWTRSDICCVQVLAVLTFAIGIAAGIVIGIYALKDVVEDDDKCPAVANSINNQNLQLSTEPLSTAANAPSLQSDECPDRNPVSSTSYEDTVYAPLTAAEMEKTAKFLLQKGIISILTTPRSLTENFILYQTFLPPVKKEALAYLDNGGTKPKRYAKVTVQRGKVQTPDIMEYKVGPLDASSMSVTAITNPGDVPFNARPYDAIETYVMEEILSDDLEITLAPLIAESFDGAAYPDDIWINFYNGPPSTTGNTRNVR